MTRLVSSRPYASSSTADPAARTAAVIATTTGPSDVTRVALRRLPPDVTGLVIRADLVGDVDPRPLRRHFSGLVAYALRGSVPGRHLRLLAAARAYDVVELDAERDLTPELLAAIPADRRCVAWRGPAVGLVRLRQQFDRMSRVPAWLYVLAPEATTSQEALIPLRLLKELGRADVTAYGSGPDAAWTRVLAAWFGAAVAFGRVAGPTDGRPADAPTVEQLLVDYGYPRLSPLRDLYGIAARSTNTTLFLQRHNAAYRQSRLPALMLPFRVVDPYAFRARFWPGLAEGLDELGLRLGGLTVAAPSKEAALDVAETVSPDAVAAGAANLLLRQPDGWLADTTDGAAVVPALAGAGDLTGVPVAVVGCGGAGRALARALHTAGAKVTLVNRGERRGRYATRLLGLPYTSLADFDPADYRVVVHATPARTEVPFDPARLAPGTVVVDAVCAAEETALARAARARRLVVVDGHEVLARQAAYQFERMTTATWPGANP